MKSEVAIDVGRVLFVIVYIGGPHHGEVEALPGHPLDAPRRVTFQQLVNGRRVPDAVYERRAEMDTPGRIAYAFCPAPKEGE